MDKGDNIILIGFMGCGKTTFGRWLEANCGRRLIDTDEYIAGKEGRSISSIFAEEGEEYFRELETRTLKELLAAGTKGAVLSVGGGMPIREQNGRLLKELGTIVYLKAGTDILVQRLEKDRSRPLLAGGDIRGKIEKLMESRADIYESRADLIIDTDKRTFEETYEILKSGLEG